MRVLFGFVALLVALGGVAVLGWTELNAVTAPIPGLTTASDSTSNAASSPVSASAEPVDPGAALRRTQEDMKRLMQQPPARKDATE